MPASAHQVSTVQSQDLVEPLSPRELDVLRLLATDLTGPELARHLVVSLNTLRTHTRNVYTKLGVSGRRAAVTRARDLGLLGGSMRCRGLPFVALPMGSAATAAVNRAGAR
jgi:LuxR family maltose regulon positive regulatory protein